MKHFFYIIILISFIGCNTVDRPKKPKNLIAKDKMSEIMYDLYILNAAKGINRKLLERNGIMPLEHIYKKHGIDSLQFAESNTYYAYDMETYAAITEKVKNNLQKGKDIYEELTKEEERVRDSIKEAEQKKKEAKLIKRTDSIN